jgi:hypothetical protein
MRDDILKRKTEILLWISEQRPKAFICRELSCKALTLDSYLKKFGVIYKGNKGNKGFGIAPNKKTALEYASSKNNVKSYILKNKLIEEGIKEAKCERCKNTIWNGLPIPLELHHKDGNHYNNDLINLEILCPNCHAQEPNNSRKIKK